MLPQLCFFVSIAFSLIAWGIVTRPIHLAGTPTPATGRSVAASAHPAQLPFHRVGIPGPRRRVARSAVCLRAFRGLRGHHCGDTRVAFAAIAARGAGVVIAWVFNLWGSADLLNAFYQANHAGLLAGQLGATYFIPTVVVPLLLITHGLAFRILLQHQNELRNARKPARSIRHLGHHEDSRSRATPTTNGRQ